MSRELKSHLELALKRLEKAYSAVVKTNGYNENAQKLRLLMELTKEQTPYENTRSRTR